MGSWIDPAKDCEEPCGLDLKIVPLEGWKAGDSYPIG